MTWLTGWKYRKSVRVNNASGSALTNAPAPVLLDADSFNFALALSSGADLRVTSDDGATLLSHWARRYDATDESAELWVKVPSVPASGTTTVYLYFGKSDASTTSSYDNIFAKFAPDADTLAAWHFDEGTGSTAADASDNNNDLTFGGTPAWGGADGGNWGTDDPRVVFASGSYADLGSGDGLTLTGFLDTPPANGGICFWFKVTGNPPGSNPRIINKVSSVSPDIEGVDLYIETTGSNQLRLDKYRGGGSITIRSITADYGAAKDDWEHVAVTWGSRGTELWINGVLEASNTGETGAWGPGTFREFAIGGVGGGNYINAAFDEMVVFSRQPTRDDIRALMRRRTPSVITTQIDRLTRYASNPVVAGVSAWNEDAAGEPNLWYESSEYRMIFGASPSPGTGALGYATSSDGLTWTEEADRILGEGTGGESGLACRGSVARGPDGSIYRDGSGDMYVYYTDAHSGGKLLLAKGATPLTLAKVAATTVLAATGAFWTGIANQHVIYDGTTWRAWIEFETADGYRIGYATGATATAFTEAIGAASLELMIGAGMTGGPSVLQDTASRWHMYYHAAHSGGLPTNVYHAVSADGITWHRDPHGDPVIQLGEASFAYDQVADPSVIVQGGTVWIAYSGNNNTNPSAVTSSIGVATFTGTLAALATDAPDIETLAGTAVRQMRTGIVVGTRRLGA